MKKVLVDTLAFGKQYMRSKVGAFFTFIFPILLILLFGAIFTNTGNTTIDLPVQDLDGTTLSDRFLDALNETHVVRISMVSTALDLETYVRENSLSVALLIPAGFEANVVEGLRTNGTVHANVTLYGDPSRSTLGIAEGVVQAVAEQMSFSIYQRGLLVQPRVQQVASQQYQYMDYFLPGIIGMTVMTTAMYAMTSTCAEYRSRKYFKLLATTTLTKAEWLSSKVLWFALALLVSLFATVAVGVAVWNVKLTIDVIAVAFIVLGAFLFVSLGMVLGSAVRDPESASAIANAIGFPMMFLSGSFFPFEAMPSYLQAVARVLPLTYLNNGLRDTMVFGNLDSALINLGVVAVLAVVFFVLGAKLMSWKEK